MLQRPIGTEWLASRPGRQAEATSPELKPPLPQLQPRQPRRPPPHLSLCSLRLASSRAASSLVLSRSKSSSSWSTSATAAERGGGGGSGTKLSSHISRPVPYRCVQSHDSDIVQGGGALHFRAILANCRAGGTAGTLGSSHSGAAASCWSWCHSARVLEAFKASARQPSPPSHFEENTFGLPCPCRCTWRPGPSTPPLTCACGCGH